MNTQDGDGPADPRLIFLLRVAIRYELYVAGELNLEEAFDGLADAFPFVEASA
jgi:hypothetical protein